MSWISPELIEILLTILKSGGDPAGGCHLWGIHELYERRLAGSVPETLRT